VEVARAIGASLVVSGSVVRLGAAYQLNLKLHEAAHGGLIAGAKARGKDALGVVDAAAQATRELFR
jgi:hypothetical protein